MTIYSTLHQVLYNLYIISVLKGRHYANQRILRNVNAWDDPGLQVACHHPLYTHYAHQSPKNTIIRGMKYDVH